MIHLYSKFQGYPSTSYASLAAFGGKGKRKFGDTPNPAQGRPPLRTLLGIPIARKKEVWGHPKPRSGAAAPKNPAYRRRRRQQGLLRWGEQSHNVAVHVLKLKERCPHSCGRNCNPISRNESRRPCSIRR